MSTKLVLLGTGTPNACPNASGPACAVVVDDRAYLVDFGPGVVRQASKAYYKGIDPLRPDLLTTAFCTHLHTDHTVGYADLIFTPWVLERSSPLKVFGPKGLQRMTDHLLQAYAVDIDFRLHGFERANEVGYQVQVQEIQEGIIYRDERVQVEAFSVTAHWKVMAIVLSHRMGSSWSAGIPHPCRWSPKKPRAATSCCTRSNMPQVSAAARKNGRNTTVRSTPSAPTLLSLLHRRSPSCWSPPIASTT